MQEKANSHETGIEEPVEAQAVQATREGMWRKEPFMRLKMAVMMSIEEDKWDSLEEL